MTSAQALAGTVLLILITIFSLAAVGQASQKNPQNRFLTEKLLTASPDMSGRRFKHSVVYEEPVEKLLSNEAPPINADGQKIRIHFGGPVDFGESFVLHTPDYTSEHTVIINSIFAITPGKDSALILSLAKGKGPRKSILALGYAGWSPGQLESEIEQDAWVTTTTDEAFVFEDELGEKWQRALDRREFTL